MKAFKGDYFCFEVTKKNGSPLKLEAAIVRALMDGTSEKEQIAANFGVALSFVDACEERALLKDLRKQEERPLEPDEVDEVYQRRASGASQDQIALELVIPHAAILPYLINPLPVKYLTKGRSDRTVEGLDACVTREETRKAIADDSFIIGVQHSITTYGLIRDLGAQLAGAYSLWEKGGYTFMRPPSKRASQSDLPPFSKVEAAGVLSHLASSLNQQIDDYLRSLSSTSRSYGLNLHKTIDENLAGMKTLCDLVLATISAEISQVR